VIRLAWLPTRPPSQRRHTLPYTGRRRVRRKAIARGAAAGPREDAAPRPARVNNEDMLFDQPPGELPRATLRPREPRARLTALGGALQRWLAERWTWFRPRTVPVMVAFAGMLAVLASVDYLRSFAHEAPERLTVAPDPPSVASIEVDVDVPRATEIHIDGKPWVIVTGDRAPRDLAVPPSQCKVTIVPSGQN
jgi:hypothetical protein